MKLRFLLFLPLLAHADPIPNAQPISDPSWRAQFDRQRRDLRLNSPIDVCFVGDSLSEFWTSTGRAAWNGSELKNWRKANFGIAADRVEHVRFRLSRTDFGESPPKVFVLWAGTNNLAKSPPDSPESVALQLGDAIGILRNKCLASQIVVLSIAPSGFEPKSELRGRILAANRLISKLAAAQNVEFVDLWLVFADADGNWRPGLSHDGTHLTELGYRVLAKVLSERILVF